MTSLPLPRPHARAATWLALVVWSAVAVAAGWWAAQALLRWWAVPVTPPSDGVAISRPLPNAGPAAAAAPLPSPGEGATGTIALPPLPFAPVPTATGAPARAFSLAGIAAVDRGRALECLAAAVYYEAASESDAGQRAVAQVVLNRVRHPAFPATVCGVVYQGSERAGCQFSFACDGALARAPSSDGWVRALRNAAAVLNGQVYAPVGWATHYHTFAVTPAWNRTLVMTDAVGAHFFHRWKGYWGTAAAFSQAYRGGEPAPGPHLPAADAALPASPAPAPATPSAMPRPDPLPAPAPSGTPALPESTILDRWKDSGKPLR